MINHIWSFFIKLWIFISKIVHKIANSISFSCKLNAKKVKIIPDNHPAALIVARVKVESR